MHSKTTKGRVNKNNDPAKAGRVKVNLAEVDGAEYPDWMNALMMSGWVWPPENGDTVAVEIPDGEDAVEFADEVTQLGRVYDQDNPVPKTFQTNYPKRRGFITKAKHALIIDDKAGTIEIQHGPTKASILITKAGQITITGATKVHLNVPLTDLSDTSTEFLLKGTTYNVALTALVTGWDTAIKLTTPPPTDPNWIAYKAAMTPLIAAFKLALTTFLSTKVRTG